MNVALLGLGNVGKAVFEILAKKEADIFKNYDVNVKYVLVRNTKNKNIDPELLTTSFDDIVNDEEVNVIIEMMGASVSYDYMKRALLAGKHVITANKEVTLLFVTHSTSVARDFCKRGIVMKKGKATFDGPIDEAIEHYNKILGK